MKLFRICKPYLLSRKYTLGTFIVIFLVSTSISILFPYLIGNFLDALIIDANIAVIIRFCIIFGILSILQILKNYITSVLQMKIQIHMSYSMNMDIIKHIQNLSLSYINKQDTAYLSNRIYNDSSSVVRFCIGTLQSFLVNVVVLIVPFVILLTMNWVIAVLMMLFLLIYVAIYKTFRKPLYNAGLKLKESHDYFFSKIVEQLKHIKLIKMNSIQFLFNRRMNEGYLSLQQKAIHNQKLNYFYTSLGNCTSTLSQICLFIIGGLLVIAGSFTIGMFTIFISYFNMMLGACKYFFTLGAMYQNAMAAHDRIQEILENKTESQGGSVIHSIDRIELDNVEFSYNACDSKKVIKGISASFVKGNIYGIVGENGTGKSTLINLLQGMYIDEYKGVISYNDIDIRDIDMVVARRNLIDYAEQEPQLVNDTIMFNISFGDNLSDDVAQLINVLNMQDFISEHGLDYILSEKTINTSGGEKQKIAILKALCTSPELMVFDEPSSALDKSAAENFMGYLRQVKQDKIIIIVTHDESVLASCDYVLEMATHIA